MNNKEQFDFYKKNGLFKATTEEDRIRLLVNRLLELLYSPKVQDDENNSMFVPDWRRIQEAGINKDEPINWVDLKAGVEKRLGYYLVTIDEAEPGSCPTLCEYIEKYMHSWGWNIRVETEW